MLVRCVCGGGDVTQVCVGVVYVIQVWGAVYITQVCMWGQCMLLRCVGGGSVCYSGVCVGAVYDTQVYVWGLCILLRCVGGGCVCYSGVCVGPVYFT